LPSTRDAVWDRLLAGVELWPPAQRGDVLAALGQGPETIVLLDGYYYTVPAVTHKELLYALDAGVRIIGAASMGALRAAELESSGMVGVGRIFEAFRDGELEGDDEVAILHLPKEFGYQPTTVALVELRHALGVQVQEGSVSAVEARQLILETKQLPFTERALNRIVVRARELAGGEASERLRDLLNGDGLKTDDAKLALQLTNSPALVRTPGRSAVTTFMSHYRELYMGRSVGGVGPSQHDDPTFLQAWSAVQILHPQTVGFVRQLRIRFLLSSAARSAGLRASPARERELAETLAGHVAACRRPPLLPELELIEEAKDHALAEAAFLFFGDPGSACASLARSLGLDRRRGLGQLLELLEVQGDLMPPWLLIRGFLFSSCWDGGRNTAAAAAEVRRAFESWANGARITKDHLLGRAAVLWSCKVDEVWVEAARRGLFPTHGFSPDFIEALELIAPAEHLEKPINEYTRCRADLRDTPLEHALDISFSETGTLGPTASLVRPNVVEEASHSTRLDPPHATFGLTP
jgi:hypothetical protein